MSASDPFFADVPQRDVTIRGVPAKAPMFIRDLSLMMGIFTADARAARALLPGPELRPLTLPTGRALLGVSCFAYHDTDIAPYHEVALGIAVAPPGRGGAGAGAAARASLRQAYHAFVADLPVNTPLAVAGGVDFFNYPKHLTDIRYDQDERTRACRVCALDSGALLYAFEGARLPTRPRPPDSGEDLCTFWSYPLLEGRLHRATFRVRQIERATRRLRGGMRVTVGDHPRSALLAGLRVGALLQYTYVPRAQGILYEPQPLELAP